MKCIFTVVLVAVLGLSIVQAPEAQTSPAASAVSTPLTHAELITVTHDADRAISIVLQLGRPESRDGENRPATRAEVLAEFDRLLTRYESRALITPVAPAMNAEVLDRLPADERKLAQRLIRYRVVAPVGNLLVASDDGVTLSEFGRALGFFMTGIAEITHRPSREFSPRLSEF